MAQMQPNALAVFNSNDIFTTGADSTLPFHQHRNIFYLSGVDQEESILILFSDAMNSIHKEILFIKETNKHIAIWEGAKLSKKQATEVSGIQAVYWLKEFDTMFEAMMKKTQTVYFNNNNHYRQAVEMETREDRFIKKLKNDYPNHSIKNNFPIMQALRGVKEPEEIELIQQACNITEKGFKRVLGFVKPGIKEYEIEAEYAHEFLKNRSKGFAYTPIIASGYNACVLHYTDNNKPLRDGDLVLIDAGCEYQHYAADITRTFPVSGEFSAPQRALYEIVLAANEAAIAECRPGVSFNAPHQAAIKVMVEGLLKLGLLQGTVQDNLKNETYLQYCPHKSCHWLGLDVHDVGDYRLADQWRPLQPGMVLTVEPGIYVTSETTDPRAVEAFRGTGIRIEDDVLITADGSRVLSRKVPKTIDAIEALTRS